MNKLEFTIRKPIIRCLVEGQSIRPKSADRRWQGLRRLSGQGFTRPAMPVHSDRRNPVLHLCEGKERTRRQIRLDGSRQSLNLGGDAHYAQRVKGYGEPKDAETRYSPSVCPGVRKRRVEIRPGPGHVPTGYAERNNLTMWMSVRRFTRLTDTFSTKIENHARSVALYVMHSNFCRQSKQPGRDRLRHGLWHRGSAVGYRGHRPAGGRNGLEARPARPRQEKKFKPTHRPVRGSVDLPAGGREDRSATT